jgi:hypothetical protein
MATEKSDQPITSEDIRSSVQEILEPFSEVVGLTISEINRRLWAKGLQIPWDWLKDSIDRMIRDEVLEERPHPGRKGKVYHLPGYGITQMSLLFDRQYTRVDIELEGRAELDLWIEDEAERERMTVSVLHDIATGHAREASFAEQIRKAAPALAAEKPIDLILEMAEWVVNDLNRLAEKMRSLAQTHAEEMHRLTREIGFRRIKAVRFFQRLWRLDAPAEGFTGILDIPTIPQMMSGERAKIDSKRARERLQKRIVGNRLIEVVSVPANMHKAAVGTDASVGDVQIRHEQGSFIPPTPAVLFVASGAMRVRDQDVMKPYWDYDIDPRELEKYEDLEAAQKGLLISPRLRREAITDFRHLRSAAMELRQYTEELRVVRNETEWHPVSGAPELRQPPTTTLLIRDGRIFPLVHRLDDYDGASAPDDVLYGEVVRREIKAFHQVFQNTAGIGKLGTVYGGTVKSPEFSWFAMLTFWYLGVKQGDRELLDGFYRPPLNDQAVRHLLFWGLVESDRSAILDNPRNMLMTFRAVRRFSDIAFPAHPLVIENVNSNIDRFVDEDNEDDWIDYIDQHIREANKRYYRHQRGIPALSTAKEYGAFLDLCRRAGVAMFYGAPARMYKAVLDSRSHFLSPRWELTADVALSNLDYHLEQMLAWLVDEGGLVRDESHAVGGFEEAVEGLPLFIPDVVMQAHEMVVYTKKRHVPDIEDRLQKLVRDIRDGKLPSVQP